MTELHKRVRAARRAAKLTQADVAERAGISLGTYQTFETGKSEPQAGNLQAILAVFGTDFEAEAIEAAEVEATREELPGDIRVFVDMMSAWLLTMDVEQRLEVIHDETRRIMRSR